MRWSRNARSAPLTVRARATFSRSIVSFEIRGTGFPQCADQRPAWVSSLVARRSTHRSTLMWFPTNATIRSNMSPVFDRSGAWPACRSASMYSSAISPPALR